MNKQLLDQVQQALQAQHDTIQRQDQMLNDRDRDIAELQNLLKQLTATQSEQLQQLPTLYEQLNHTISEQRKAYNGWITQRKTLLELMNKLVHDSITLCNAQNRLTERMKEYQSTIALERSLSSDMEPLENELNELASSQQRIINSQQLLKEQQEDLLKQLSK